MTKLIVIATFALAGCSSNSGAFQIAPGKYRVTTSATWELGGRAGATAMALKEATRHCESLGKTPEVIDEKSAYGHWTGGQVDMTFTCQ